MCARRTCVNWMSYAIDLAKKGRHTCPPNPAVGCVIIKDNQLVGQGFHRVTGGPHAEIIALEQAQEHARKADVYLTLEPCAHFGRTPPCVDALIRAGVKRVFVAATDPNPKVKAQGLKKLRDAGIEAVLGNYQEAYDLNEDFFHAMRHKRPFVIAKWAMSLDGKIANSQAKSKWITSIPARAHAHALRAQVCAIMVGARTVRLDNPMLTVRHNVDERLVRQPRPIIVSKSGQIPLDSHVLQSERRPIVITSAHASSACLKEFDNKNIEYYIFKLINNKFCMKAVLEKLFISCELKNILAEGGSELLTSLHEEKLINQIYAYIAPKLIGGSNSLTPILGVDLKEPAHFEELHSQELINLEPDICLKAKTSISPRSYEEFLQSCDDYV